MNGWMSGGERGASIRRTKKLFCYEAKPSRY